MIEEIIFWAFLGRGGSVALLHGDFQNYLYSW